MRLRILTFALTLSCLIVTPIASAGPSCCSLGKAMKKGWKNVRNTLKKAERDVRRESGKVSHNVVYEVGKGAQNLATEMNVGLKNLENESIRVGPHIVDLGQALANFTTRTVSGYGRVIEDANRRLLQGKLGDALFHLALDPLRNEEKNLFKATQECGWIKSIGAIAAAAYGGPGGAAGYAAWQVYRSTDGNAELALRAGLLAGFSYMGNTELGQLKMTEEFALVKKSVMAGALGGLAIAAAGGSDKDVMNGFILAGGMVIIQDGYKEATGQKLDARAPTADSYCATPDSQGCDIFKDAYYTDEKGRLRINYSKLNPRAAYVGEGYMPNFNEAQVEEWMKDSWRQDKSVFMRTVGKMPGFNAMGLFHDNWVLAWGMADDARNQLTIFPALVMTHYGTGHMLSEKITEVAVKSGSSSKESQLLTRQDLTQEPGLFVAKTLPEQIIPKEFDLDPANIKRTTGYHVAQTNLVPPGRYIMVRNVATGKLQRALVISELPEEMKSQADTRILLSTKTMHSLGLNDDERLVQAEPEDLILVSTVDPKPFEMRTDVDESAYYNKGDTLTFSDFDEQETIDWKLTIMGPGGAKTIEKFDNHWQIDLQPGNYFYIMTFEDATQIPWGYKGFLKVMGTIDPGIWQGTGSDKATVESSYLLVNGHKFDADGELNDGMANISVEGKYLLIMYNVPQQNAKLTDTYFTENCSTCLGVMLTDADTGKLFIGVAGELKRSDSTISFTFEITELNNIGDSYAPKFKISGKLGV